MNDLRGRELSAELVSDGTLAGTEVRLNGRRITNIAAVDLRIAPEGSSLLLSVGHAVIDYGTVASVNVRGIPATIRPAETPAPPD